MTLTDLTVERLPRPIHVWTSTPRFGWRLPAGSEYRQRAYEVELFRASDRQLIATTGKVESATSHSVIIPATTLSPRTPYDWRVRVWTGGEEPTAWAESAFETTIFDPTEWKAHWVEPAQQTVTPEPELAFDAAPVDTGERPLEDRLHPSPLLRQSFTLKDVPNRARLYITAHGIYEVTVNGLSVTDEVLAPGYDEYTKRLSFQTYDATPALHVGENVIGVRLSDGWWAGRISFTGSSANYGDRLGVLWQLESDGKVVVVSGDTARSATGDNPYADIFIGEKFDARLVRPGWDLPGFNDSEWSPVSIPANGDLSTLVPFVGEPVRRVAEIRNPRILNTPNGELIVDLGQNIAGRLRLTARGERGTTITLEHTESLDRDGNYQQNIMGRNKDQTDVWVLAGDGAATWEPRFTYHGFRYVRVTGYPGKLRAEDVVGVVIASDLSETGRFRTDDARINQLHQNIVWSQRSNFLSIPTDCPQRERAGWTGDVQVFGPAATNNARVDLFFERWLANVRAAQTDDGIVPTIVPFTPSFATTMSAFGAVTSSGWGDVITMLPLALYERYGDKTVLAENYDAMRRWLDWVRTQAETQTTDAYSGLPDDNPDRRRQKLLWNTGHHFGDWLVPSTVTDDQASLMVAAQLTGGLVGSAFYFLSATNIARTATILGDDRTAQEMTELAGLIRDAFILEYVEDDGRLTAHMQGTYVLALAFDLIPENRRDAAGQHLVNLIHAANDHLDTGFLSVPYLLDVLVATGEKDLAYRLLFQDTVPSWLYEVKMGATTMWESWAGITPDGQPQHLSLNHYAFGAVDDWLFRHVAGIRAAQPGYAQISFKPDLNAPFTTVDAAIGTPYGEASIAWTKRELFTEISIALPGNVEATLTVPGQDPMHVTAGGLTVSVQNILDSAVN